MSLSGQDRERITELKCEFSIEDLFSDQEVMDRFEEMVSTCTQRDCNAMMSFKQFAQTHFAIDDMYSDQEIAEYASDYLRLDDCFRDRAIEEYARNRLDMHEKDEGIENIFDLDEIEEFASNSMGMINPQEIFEDLEEGS